ncbi:N-acetyl-gamma-glutamyl-phosphate reductase [Aerococcus agrisoli]|uniref:N-acetyl-gamma-glutamyl-phosphate reductase n=1 Tax=Aerococcus agrisoli TaxID=2487350 RepID=A0A3N4HF06_9LACT|nr:N-acetyl-gamma-glutamyl-phosphate reductase [Aerococcus agrisoli]RPA65074.1 N-acetyl-gamma-glutamyl-phosphate reductase [Aerococcus agrisoli]
MIKVAIVGATGYTGEELMRLLLPRPDVDIAYVTSRQAAGTPVQSYFPQFMGLIDQKFVAYEADKILPNVDVIFLCLPQGVAMEMVPEALRYGVKVIDLSGDFRLQDTAVYEKYYGIPQSAPELLPQAVYGLPEINRHTVKGAQLIANPGCFVTCSLLGLLPVIGADFIDQSSIIIDAKTGVSGAGRSAKISNLLTELGNNFYAYNPLTHRHIPEIEQILSLEAGEEIQVQFTPHLLPTERGIHATIYVNLKEDITEDAIRALYQDYYQDEYFVHVLSEEAGLPQIKHVRGSNFTQIQVKVDVRTNRLIIFAVIDNLMKGASGQAVQNMNIMYGLEENLGLTQIPLMP